MRYCYYITDYEQVKMLRNEWILDIHAVQCKEPVLSCLYILYRYETSSVPMIHYVHKSLT